MAIQAGAVVPRRPRVWPWVLTLVAGLALCAVGVGAYAATAVVGLLDHSGQPTPRVETLELDPGTYVVFEALAQPALGIERIPILTPSSVSVTASSGAQLTPGVPGTVETRTVGDISYTGVVDFSVVHSDSYRVRVTVPPGSGSQTLVFVAPSFTSSLSKGLGWLGLALLGGIVALLGLVLLIVQSVRRSRLRAPPAPGPRCANGHPAMPSDRFCPACGAPMGAPAPVGQPQ